MSLIVQNYNNSTTDEYGTFLTVDRQMGSGVVDGLLVAANATPNMTVYVQPGSGLIPTGTYPSSYNYRFAIDTALPGAAVTIGTAAASPRIDYIVAYVDKTVAGSNAGANVNNTNGVLKLADVQGTPAGSPSVPTTAQIQSTIGASNPYIILAQIAVGANVTTITNTNITDLRSFASDRNDAALGASSYVDNGLVWTLTTGLSGSMTAGKAYINVGGTMVPASASAISSYTFTASQDTYVSINVNGTISYSPVANGANSPTLPTNSIWVARIITNGTTITTVDTTGIDSNKVLICPRSAGFKTIDANGWSVYNYGAFREWQINVQNTNQSFGASASGGYTTINLPVGVASLANVNFSFNGNITDPGDAVIFGTSSTSSSTNIGVTYRNLYGGTVSGTTVTLNAQLRVK